MGLQESAIFFRHVRYRHFFLCRYLPLAAGIDTVSRSLLKFKRGLQPDLGNWIDRAVCGFRGISGGLAADTIIIRALHHRETLSGTDRPSSLDDLGRSLSTSLGLPFHPEFLRKTRMTTMNQGLSRAEREEELRDVYIINPSLRANPASILLLDDILTTGATVLSVLGTLRATWPGCVVTVFTLAKVD